MTYSLIDNASLTAVQRVLGEIAIKNPDTINGDLVALENLIQAILFYDELICVDNYKERYREERVRQFPFIRFIQPSDQELQPIDQAARREASQMKPQIKGGEFADKDFRDFLDLLKMNIVCTWDLSSSVYYLTMKMLGQPQTEQYEKYRELSASIFAELADSGETRGRWSTDATLIGSDGAVYTKDAFEEARKNQVRGLGGTTRALEMFIASLNWLSYKTIYYSYLSKYFMADSFLHPIRHAFQIHWMKKSGVYGHDFTAKLVSALADDIGSTVGSVVDAGRNATVPLSLPFFSAYLVRQAGDVGKVIEAALETRASSDISEIRETLREIRHAFDEQGLAAANKNVIKWQKELAKASAATRSKYGIKTAQGIPSSKIMNVYNSVAALAQLPQFPDFGFKMPFPEVFHTKRSKGFANVYKDVTKELTTVERLGGVRDLLAKRFVFEDGWNERYTPPKTEDPKFRRRSSEWKLPM